MTSLPIRTLQLRPQPTSTDGDFKPPLVSLARLGGNQEQVVLIHDAALPDDDEPVWDVWAHLSVLVPEDPFPGYALDGREMIWLKDYSENAGLKEQLLEAGWIAPVGRTTKQGFISLPLMLLQLSETEYAHQCAFEECNAWEAPRARAAEAAGAVDGGVEEVATEGVQAEEGRKRFGKCSKCKSRWYCSTAHQQADWSAHKGFCKLLVERKRAEVVNRHRKAIQSWMNSAGMPNEEAQM